MSKATGIEPGPGKLLIAEPFMKDARFSRTVVLLCEHGKSGSVGFVLNKPLDYRLGALVPDFPYPDLPLFDGGPLRPDRLHIIHRSPGAMGGLPIGDGLVWGGSYEELSECLGKNPACLGSIMLFVGYSGWGEGQLEQELEEGAWLVADGNADIVFDTKPTVVWKKSIESLGKRFAPWAHLPTHPQLN